MSTTFLDKKGKRGGRSIGQSVKKRHRPLNRYEMEQDEASTSTSAKKLKSSENIDVRVDSTFGYRILDFLTVFSVIRSVVKCRNCDGDVRFEEASVRGLGFKLLIVCDSCEPTAVNSCPLIDNKAYDINRRIIFAFRLLGVDLKGVGKFCGIMDLPKPIFHSFYDKVIGNILSAAEAVCKVSMKNAVNEEKHLNAEKGNDPGLSVSGDGTWQKRGFSSLFGVSTLIGWYTGKVLDLTVKSAVCKMCDVWKNILDIAEYDLWKASHEDNCEINHEGSAGKMEIDAIKEMFQTSEEKYGVKYTNYIGDGDSKTYKSIIDGKPYGDTVIKKKECIGHVQKRMGTLLRNVKEQRKGLGGKGKLTGKLINELTIYYGLAIRNNLNSKEEMKKAIWATFYHKISTDKKPQHQNCPLGTDSWCSWQKAKANGTLKEYKHKQPLHKDVEEAIKPIYEDLSSNDLLERCEGGFTQNNNESINSVIWKIAPKAENNGAKIVEIAAYITASIFNDGFKNVLLMMQTMGLKIGTQCNELSQEIDATRIFNADLRAQQSTKEARQQRRAMLKEAEDINQAAEGLLYGAGIAD